MALLEVTGIDVFYGRVQALRSESLQVDQGEVVALIGSNGAGKTTTLRTISGLQHPVRGTITFDGKDITREEPQNIVNLGICQSPEGRRLFTRMTVLDNLRMGAYTRRSQADIKKDMDRVFELFPRLKERLNQVAGTLSGGEQQMCAMGRALMAKPKLLIAVGRREHVAIGRQTRLRADLDQRPLDRADVADAVVDDGDHPRTPLDDGMPGPPVVDIASWSARPSALKVASTMWWRLRPRTTSTWIVVPR
jgi:ABC-type uncharacterized transport system ATPase subunit